MIKIENLSYGYPQKDLYNNISFTIEKDSHCALIGVSGSGKSTLANILIDSEKYMFTGKLEITSPIKSGYVSQFLNPENKDITVFEYMAEKHISLQNEINQICIELETANDAENLLELYQSKLDEFDSIDGYDYEKNINTMLGLANLSHLLNLKLSTISGGEFKLIQIIREMLLKPDLLVMDEPDVFLDFNHLNSLKNLINSHKKALLIITHSRFLLNHCFNKIIHLEDTIIQEFDGSYIEYNFNLLADKIEQKEQSIQDDEEVERNEKLIERLRFRASYNSEASCGRALGARVRHLKRLEEKRVHNPFLHLDKPAISLITNNPIENQVDDALTVSHLNVSFDNFFLKDVNFTIGSNDKVAIIGPNGAGKTTLLRSIFENKDHIEINSQINLAYLSQNQGETLNEEQTIFDLFFDLNFPTYDSIREFLEPFSIKGEMLDQQIKKLSGGEKNILQLAVISSTNANFLLLDEPTSHLDTYAQIALEEGIKNYNGAIIMVSHDFYTIANSVDYVILIENNTSRKVKLKKFKRNIYSSYFDKEYLSLEEEKNKLEHQIEECIHSNEFEKAIKLLDDLSLVIEEIKKVLTN